jgi:hypothetical protein
LLTGAEISMLFLNKKARCMSPGFFSCIVWQQGQFQHPIRFFKWRLTFHKLPLRSITRMLVAVLNG